MLLTSVVSVNRFHYLEHTKHLHRISWILIQKLLWRRRLSMNDGYMDKTYQQTTTYRPDSPSCSACKLHPLSQPTSGSSIPGQQPTLETCWHHLRQQSITVLYLPPLTRKWPHANNVIEAHATAANLSGVIFWAVSVAMAEERDGVQNVLYTTNTSLIHC